MQKGQLGHHAIFSVSNPHLYGIKLFFSKIEVLLQYEKGQQRLRLLAKSAGCPMLFTVGTIPVQLGSNGPD